MEVYADAVDQGNVYEGPHVTDEDVASLAEIVAERVYDPTRGLHWHQYWLSPELASAARPGERITIKQLLDPNVAYAYTRSGVFIGALRPRAEAHIADVLHVQSDRAAREQFVKRHIAGPKAAAAREAATQAWDEVADGLADAAHSTTEADATASDSAPDSGPDSGPDADPTARPDARRVIRPSSRRRKAPKGEMSTTATRKDDADADADADAVADLFRRTTPRASDTPTSGAHDTESNIEGGEDDAE